MELYNLRESPFLDFRSPFTSWELLKMVVLLPLVPVRLLLAFLVIGLVAFINTLATVGWPEGRPLSVSRRRLVEAGAHLCIIVLWCAGFHVRIEGWENVEKAKKLRAVGVFNHVSYVDTLLLFWMFLPCGVSKRSNSKIPVVGKCIRCLNNIYVDDSARAIRSQHASTPAPPTTTSSSQPDPLTAPLLMEHRQNSPASPPGTPTSANPTNLTCQGLSKPPTASTEDSLFSPQTPTCVPEKPTFSPENPIFSPTNPTFSPAGTMSGSGNPMSPMSPPRHPTFSPEKSAFSPRHATCTPNPTISPRTPMSGSGNPANGPGNMPAVPGNLASTSPPSGSYQPPVVASTLVTELEDLEKPDLVSSPLPGPDSSDQISAPTVKCVVTSAPSSVTAAIIARVTNPLYLAPGGYPMLFIAPEGTVTNGQSLIKFRNGAFVSGAPVMPVLLKYPFRHFNPAYTETHVPFHLLRLLCQWFNRLEVTILPPYVPSPKEVADPSLYAANVRQLMAEQLAVPLVAQDYGHCHAMRKRGIAMSWDGKHLHGPQDEIDADLNIMLQLPSKRS